MRAPVAGPVPRCTKSESQSERASEIQPGTVTRNAAGVRFSGTGFPGCGKTKNSVILSEAKNLSLFLFLYLNRREILRFAQNENMKARLLPSAIRCRWETFKERSRA